MTTKRTSMREDSDELTRLFRRINRLQGGWDEDQSEREALLSRRDALCFRLQRAGIPPSSRGRAQVPAPLLKDLRALADAVDAFNNR